MSIPKLISPMLDNFDMGGPISDHDGVRCCPAMRKNSDDKYIVKIISVPASQTKLDALLLTGAYPDQASALVYFKDLADGIIEEKKILDGLAKLEGFLPFEDCQIVPMDDAIGFDVYLLSEYKMTLERSQAKHPLTQLAAVNLGIDLCTALTACRRSGYMFIDLKPSNIYIVGDHEYRIGDLGFVRLNSLKYESLPDKYRSCYTAPEAEDAFAALSDTMDIYAAGLVLYQAYNGGTLPFSGSQAPNIKFAAPAYADEEMSSIILKACDPNPNERWSDPVQMGQAIVSYMQKNGVNDTPLTAEYFGKQDQSDEVADVDNVEEPVNLEIDSDVSDEISGTLPVVFDAAETSEDESISLDTLLADVDAVIPESDAEHEVLTSQEEAILDTALDNACTDDISLSVDEASSNEESSESSQEAGDEESVNTADTDLSFLDNLDDIELCESVEGLSDEIAEILDHVDELTAHQVPDPVVAPEPVEIKLPDPLPAEEAGEEETVSIEEETVVEDQIEVEPSTAEELPEEERPYVPKKKRTGLVWLIVILILLALVAGGYVFYTQYYLQPIHTLDLTGTEDRLQVNLTSDINETLLTVVCADSHGNKISAPIVGGTAVFSGLMPDTAYTVTVEIDGLHKLTGTVSKVYSTPIQTKIAQMNVVTGSESGSVILSFAVEGPDSDQWNVIYNADGEAERVTTFPSHVVTLTGLTVGKEYTFRLEPVDDVYLSSEGETTYVVKNLICAEDLRVTGCADGVLTVQWNTPANEEVSEWTVRCYNDAGYDETIFTSENTATFENIDDTVAHSVEVTAAEMSVNQRVQVSANSITVSDFTVDAGDASILSLKWNANRDIPAEGWTIRYSVNGIAAPSIVTSQENSAEIPVVPNGNYIFTIIDGNGNAVLGGPFVHTQESAAPFDSFGIKNTDITVRLCKTPSSSSWSYADLTDEDYANSFSAGQKISMVLSVASEPDTSTSNILATFAIYDDNENLVCYSHDTQIWQTMWYQNYCELDIPSVPSEVGTYKVVLFLNGAEAGSQKFEITA